MRTVNINSYSVDGIPITKFSRKTLQDIFGISHRGKWRERLEACGFTTEWFCQKLGISESEYSPRLVSSMAIFQVEDVKKLSLLDLFLSIKKGRSGFSKDLFQQLNENDYLATLEQTYDLNPIQHFKQLFEAYKNGK
jgi:hypothetical protein